MSERKPAVIKVGKELLRITLVTAAAVGSATGMPWLAGVTAVPDALMDSEALKQLLNKQKTEPLTLPAPPFWTRSAEDWQSTCAHIEHHMPDILRDVEKQLQDQKVAPTQQMVRQALIDAIARHLPHWEIPAQERDGVANHIAPLLLQHSASELRAIIDPIHNDKMAEMVLQIMQQLSTPNQLALPATTAVAAANTTNAPTTSASAPAPMTPLEQKIQQQAYDVFLCYAEADESEVLKLAEQLKARNLLPWLDIMDGQPGLSMPKQQAKQIEHIPAAAIIVGQHAVKNWQEFLMYAFIEQFVARQLPVIPVLLAGTFQRPELPLFLRNFGWVDFRRQIPDPLNQLQWGITGKRP